MTIPMTIPRAVKDWKPSASREAFGLPRDRVWLNCAQMAPLHESVLAAGVDGVRRKTAPWNAVPHSFFGELDLVRAEFARLIGATADDVATIPSCSYGVATAARNLPLAPGESVVVVEGQFPSNLLSWRRAAEEAGADLVVAPRAADGAITETLLEAVEDRTAVVACAAAHWSDGTPVDLPAVAERARAVGAALVLDLTQTLGAVPFDVAAIDPDYVVCPSYKWLLGPYTHGCLYVAPRRQDGVPLEETGANRAWPDGPRPLDAIPEAYLAGARRFDMGEKAHFHVTPMLLAGLRLVNAWGPERIGRAAGAVTGRLADALAARGFSAPPERLRSPHFFGVRPPESAPEDLVDRLWANGIHVTRRGPMLRIAAHVWNDEEDEARFLAAIDALL
ncbi:MAG: aminotransferase class V-fold PLP-dependent enzyme [Pseudomonadota bacterium]